MLGLAARHRGIEPSPVGGAQFFRDDQVEALADGFAGGEAEEALGGGVPDADDALLVGVDQRIAGLLQDVFGSDVHAAVSR